MRILIVTNMYPGYGSATSGIFVKEQVDALAAERVNTDVLVIPSYKSALWYLAALFMVFYRTLRTRYDAVHAHYGFSGVASLLRWRTPLVTTFHGSDINIPWQRKISALAYRWGSESIFVSERLRMNMGGRDGYVIPCGIDLERFIPSSASDARKRLGLPDDRKIVAFPGSRDNPVKNVQLFDACISLLDVHEYMPLYLSGYAYEEMPLVLSAVDVLLMTSFHEGSPMVVKEALACNTPVVSVDVGDVGEYLADIPGCAICPRDPAGLAEKVREAAERQEINIREYIIGFGSRDIARRLNAVYREIAEVG